MAKKITGNITWVGKTDWELKMFHGNELSTRRGSSYNAYLLRGAERTVLIDTVWGPYDKEFVARLREETDLKAIDAIVMQHNESDHSDRHSAVYCFFLRLTHARNSFFTD